MEINLQKKAAELRLETLKIFEARGFGHIGGAMSLCEAIAVIYSKYMRIRPKEPRWQDRDRLVCSKGHAGPVIYAALAEKGFFAREVLKTLNREGTNLPSHCDMNKTPGIDMTTGSLGQGISTAIGIAIGQKLRGTDARTFLIVGDGECNEGQIWEGLMLAAHRKLGNLIIFCDQNKQQLDGYTKDVLDMLDLEAKFNSFGFHTQTVDGHDTTAIDNAIGNAINAKDAPSMIILDTTKGYGCTFAEGVFENHHIAFKPEQMAEALAFCEEKIREVSA